MFRIIQELLNANIAEQGKLCLNWKMKRPPACLTEPETYVEMNDYTDAEVNNYSEEPVDYGYNDTQSDAGYSEVEIDSNNFTLAGR